MGLTDTFARIRVLPKDQQLRFAIAAIDEPDGAVQLAALQLLVEPSGLHRLDLVVDHYQALLPAVRQEVRGNRDEFLHIARDKVIATRDPLRHCAYELIADLGPLASVELLALGLADPSDRVRDVVLPGLERHLRAFEAMHHPGLQGDGSTGSAPNEPQHLAAREALRAVLHHFPSHRRTVFLEILVGLGSAALAIVNGVVLAQRDSELQRAFAATLRAATGPGAVELLLHMAINKSTAAQGLSHQLLRERTDEAFGIAVASCVAAVPDGSPLADGLRETPWPSAVLPVAPLLPRPVADRLLDLVQNSRREPVRRQEHVEAFLGHPDADVACRAVQALAALRCPAGLLAVERILANAPDQVRKAAAQLVIELDPPNKAALLTPLLGSANAELRHQAMQEVAKVSFAKFMSRFDEMEPEARQVAARALAKIDARMLDRLADEIASLDARRRRKALQIVTFLNAEQELREPLLELLDDPDTHVRATAIRIVQLTGSVGGVKVLLGALVDDDRRVRANAIEAFEHLDDPRYVQLLTPFLLDPDNRVRANAIKALWNLGCPEAQDALLAMLADRDAAKRLSAVWVLGEVRVPGTRALLEQRAAVESNERVLAKIREVAAGLGVAPGVLA